MPRRYAFSILCRLAPRRNKYRESPLFHSPPPAWVSPPASWPGTIYRRSNQPTIRAGGSHPPCGTRCMAPQLHEEKTGLPCALCESGRAKNNYFG